MYDLSKELVRFYWDEVILGKDERGKLAGYRDTNLERLCGGLKDLGEEHGVTYAEPIDVRNQGSYAMHTLNRHKDNDYDIDVALIFEKDDLPADAKAARERVRDAFLKRSQGFIKDPEARKNAVTVWYAEGYHIDFAVYRRWTDWLGITRYEHAGAEGWVERDPDKVTSWFKEQVTVKSPSGFLVTVKEQQLRRIVRHMKWFAKSRSSWSLPGGMILSALVAETYRANWFRDDVALYDTIVALRDRLTLSTTAMNPIYPDRELTAKDECRLQVENLLEKLGKAVEKLAVLQRADCTEAQARSAWRWFFNHDFWTAGQEQVSVKTEASRAVARAFTVDITCGLAKREGALVYGTHRSGVGVLPKGVALRFTVANTNVPPPYSIRWIVQNEGDEARAAGQMDWQQDNGGVERWTSTAYRGDHSMVCQIHRGGVVLAEAVHRVRIRDEARRGFFRCR